MATMIPASYSHIVTGYTCPSRPLRNLGGGVDESRGLVARLVDAQEEIRFAEGYVLPMV